MFFVSNIFIDFEYTFLFLFLLTELAVNKYSDIEIKKNGKHKYFKQ